MAKKRKTAAAGAGLSSVRAVDRAIAILQCFTAERPAMSVIEIQKRVGLSRPTLYRLLHTLASHGLVHAGGDPQRFMLAQGVMKLANVWLKGLDVVSVARPIVEGLRDATGETAALFSLQEDRGICVLECESRHVLSISRGVGDSMKITQGATGKAMLAFMEDERQDELLKHIPHNAQRVLLEDALRSAKRNGYTISRGEIFVGAVAVSSPYFDHRGSVVGSIGLYGPSARVSDDKIAEFATLVGEAGQKISSLLGFHEPKPTAGKTRDLDAAGHSPAAMSRLKAVRVRRDPV